jgi:hypothetical protein
MLLKLAIVSDVCLIRSEFTWLLATLSTRETEQKVGRKENIIISMPGC